MTEYLVVDVETVPLALGDYLEADEEERLDYLNPMDSKVIAAGLRANDTNKIFSGKDESELLTDFWDEWSAIRQGDRDINVVGFNIDEFDMPMLTSRSFQNDVIVSPFLMKELIDLRERICAFKWRPKGTLQDYAESVGLSPSTGGGENVAFWYQDDEFDKIVGHLEEDLEITDELYKRARELNITKIDKW